MKKITILFLCISVLSAVFAQEILHVSCFEETLALQTLAGKIKLDSPGSSSKHSFQLTTLPKGKNFIATARKMLPRSAYWGSTAELVCEVKGSGQFYFELHILYRNINGKSAFKSIKSPVFKASSDQYKQFKWQYQITQSGIFQVGAAITAVGEKTVLNADNFLFSLHNSNDITPVLNLIETVQGKTATAFFNIDSKKSSLRTFDGKQFADAANTEKSIAVKSAVNSTMTGVISENSGAYTNIHYRTENDWKRLENIARQIKIKAPRKLLLIGDSLSDFDRNENYIDKWSFWMNLYNPGKFTIRNAGVAGDYTTMALRRIKGDKNAFGAFRYVNLENEKFDYVIIFLGHNDCRKSYRPSQKIYTPLVTPEQLEKNLRELFTIFKKRYNAKIIAVTPAASDFKVSTKRVATAMQKCTSHTIFGDPALLDSYSKILKKVTAEFDGNILDMLEISRKNSNMKKFFQNDGVHLNRQGHEFAAEEFLNFSVKHIK